MGAWIETLINMAGIKRSEVAPYVGAWIETRPLPSGRLGSDGRTLRGCVD